LLPIALILADHDGGMSARAMVLALTATAALASRSAWSTATRFKADPPLQHLVGR
jgi:hypothetical protein